jgi:hypothetical protein
VTVPCQVSVFDRLRAFGTQGQLVTVTDGERKFSKKGKRKFSIKTAFTGLKGK